MTFYKRKIIQLEPWQEITGTLISIDTLNGIINLRIDIQILSLLLPVIPEQHHRNLGQFVSILRSDDEHLVYYHSQGLELRSPGEVDGDASHREKEAVGK